MTSTLNPPVFQDGDVLSASKVNRQLSCIDTLYGWFFGPNYGCDELNRASNFESWAGWVILTGDRLVVTISDIDTSGGAYGVVTFDGVTVRDHITANGTYTIALNIAANSWDYWKPYRVVVGVVRPGGFDIGSLQARNVYMKNSTVPSAGTMPSFTDATTSSAADFNAVSDGITTLEPALMLPVAGVRGGEEVTTANTSTAWTAIRKWRLQHRVNGIRVSLAITGADQAGAISARVVYDGTAVNGAEWSAAQYGHTSVIDQVFSVPSGKNVGTFYEMQLQVKQSVGGMTGWNVRLDSLYEDQISIPAGYDETTRWTHGDYAFGDSGGPPQLDTLSTNLRAISDLVGLAGTVNIVQREPITSFSLPVLANYNRRVYHARRWRWLAYQPHNWPAEFGDSDVPQPTIYWTYDGSTWNSKTLPGDAGTDQYFDMDSSPIIVGMTFYVSGVTYAIQSPYPGYVP